MKKPYYNQEIRNEIKEGKTLRATQMNLVLAFIQFKVGFTNSFPGSLFKRKKVAKIFCKLGFHKKYKYINHREVNWHLMSHEITKCKICEKIF